MSVNESVKIATNVQNEVNYSIIISHTELKHKSAFIHDLVFMYMSWDSAEVYKILPEPLCTETFSHYHAKGKKFKLFAIIQFCACSV